MIEKVYSFVKGGNVNDVYALTNKNGVKVEILTYGARIISIYAPDKNGVLGDCIVGCLTPEDYYGENNYFGATIGRYANRIGGARFTLDGNEYVLEANDNANSLHGGTSANFDRVVWNAEIEGETLAMRHVSPDGAGGYPGELSVCVRFTLTEDNALCIDYEATTDKDTVCNLTNHSYFNIGGQDTVLSHELMLKSRKITDVDGELIPHGEYIDIDDTAYSFYTPKAIGQDIFANEKWLKHCNGYDFNYCLERETAHGLEHFGYVYDKESGRRMDCYTTLPAVQLYTGCKTGESNAVGKKKYVNHCALCLETQGYPNSPNCPSFPTTVLRAGETYKEQTIYKFSVVK